MLLSWFIIQLPQLSVACMQLSVDIGLFLGALFAAVATMETICTLCGAAIFNSIYPLFLRVGLNGFCFLVMAVLMMAALVLTE